MASLKDDQVPSHFFRANLCPEIGRMKISAEFVEYHGNSITEEAILEVDHGSLTWKIGVERCEGELWLVQGWKELVEHYSIRFAHILMFRYKGESRFDVSIYDPSLMEVQYPEVVETKDEETSDDDVDEDDEEDDDYDECPQRRFRSNEKSCANKSSPKRRPRSHSTSAQEEVKKQANAFHCEKPSFITIIQPYHLGPKTCLYVPFKHAKDYLIEKGASKICLSNGDNSWIVPYSLIGKSHRVRLSTSGWRPFTTMNHLEVGDTCVFELVDGAKLAYKVTIFRIADHA